MIVQLYCAYGAGSDTADFITRYIELEGKKILKEIGFFRHAWLDFVGCFRKIPCILYPYGYAGLELLYSHLNKKMISDEAFQYLKDSGFTVE